MPEYTIFSGPRWRAMFRALVAATSITGSMLLNHAQAVERMMTRHDARRLGLERAWSAQIEVDRARHRVERAILKDDRLTVLTTAGVVQEFNALTGECLWTSPVGNADYPSFGPSASDKYVAIVNGSTLYVLRRQDGKPVLDRRVVGGAPGAGPAVAAEYVFVPLINGRFEGYPLNQGEDKSLTPWYYQSIGRAMVLPKATSESVVWSTDQGYLYVAASLNPVVRFRLESASEIAAPTAYHRPLVFVATTSGDVFALHEVSGDRPWKYAAGYSIERAPAAVGDRVYVTTEEPALHCVDAKTGAALWIAPHVTQFAAASGQRVYGIDDLQALVVLDARTGAILDRMLTDGTSSALVNDQTDRLYLVSNGGRLQCLHEVGAKKPLYHTPQPVAEPKPAPEATPSSSTARDAGTPPPEAETPPADAEEDPFRDLNDGGEQPPDQPADGGNFGVGNENPFELFQ